MIQAILMEENLTKDNNRRDLWFNSYYAIFLSRINPRKCTKIVNAAEDERKVYLW